VRQAQKQFPSRDGPGYYGHRDNAADPPIDYYSDNQDTGCQYVGWDSPGVDDISTNIQYAFDLSFQGRIVNSDDPDTIYQTRDWHIVLMTPPF
jgi:hypothetical protein